MASDNIEIGISLDNAEALVKTLDLGKALDELGNGIGVDNLSGKFSKLEIVVLAVKKVIEAVNFATNFAVAGENIKQIETTFENLSKTMGVASDGMIESLQKISKGTLDDTDAMKMASEAIIRLGKDANKIPEIFAVARNSAKLFGGTAEERFDQITAAVQRMSTKQLAAMGIVVNSEQAFKNYANEIGKSVSSLTDFEQRHAILNDVLKTGQNQMQKSGDSVKPIQESYAQMKVAMNDLTETLQKLASSLITDKLVSWFASKKEAIKDWKATVLASYGSIEEQYKYTIALQEKELATLKEREIALKKQAENRWNMAGAAQAMTELKAVSRAIEEHTANLEKNRAVQAQMEAEAAQKKAAKKSVGLTPEEIREAALAEEKMLQSAIKFESTKIQLAIDSANTRMSLARSDEEFEAGYLERLTLLEQQHFNKLDQMMQDNSLDQKQKIEIGLEMEKKYYADVSKLNVNKDNELKASLRNRESQETTSFGKMKAGWSAAVSEMTISVPTFTDTFKTAVTGAMSSAQAAFVGLAQNIGEGFTNMGASSKHAAEKMLLAMLSAVGDMAIAFGSFYVAKGIASAGMDVPAVVGGAALLALGGVLKGVSAGMSKNLASTEQKEMEDAKKPKWQGVGIQQDASEKERVEKELERRRDAEEREANRKLSEEEREAKKREQESEKARKELERQAAQAEKDRLMAARDMERFRSSGANKGVNIQIQGHYFETEQTKTRLMDIIRQASDSQDFNLVSVGG